MKSDLFNKVKEDFFQRCGSVNTTVSMHHMDNNKTNGVKAT